METIRRLAEAERGRAEEQSRAAGQLRKRAYYLAGVLALAVIAALAAGFFAYRANADFTRSDAQRLAAAANSLKQSVADPQLIALLSLRSISTQDTVEGDAALTEAAALPLPQRIFTGHTKGVYSVVYSPDGKYILTGSYDGSARLIDMQTGQELRRFTANETERGVRAIFSPDGRSIFAASNDSTVWKWDLKTGDVEFHLSYDDAPIDIEVSPDGKRLLIGSFAGTPRLLDAQSGATICQFIGHTLPVWELAFSPDARYVATSSVDGTARL